MTTATREHRTVTGVDPRKRYEVPVGFGEFWEAPDLAALAAKIIDRKIPDFPDCSVVYLWKAKGGASGGNETLGKTNPADKGLLGHFSQTHFVIWLAADHVDNHELTHYQVEALLYHELCHIQEEEDDHGNKKLSVRGHDFEGFISEISEYGLWLNDSKAMAKVMAEQISLFGEAELSFTMRSADNGEASLEGVVLHDISDPDDLPDAEPIDELAALNAKARAESEAAAAAQEKALATA